jgi:hypothetical protein
MGDRLRVMGNEEITWKMDTGFPITHSLSSFYLEDLVELDAKAPAGMPKAVINSVP